MKVLYCEHIFDERNTEREATGSTWGEVIESLHVEGDQFYICVDDNVYMFPACKDEPVKLGLTLPRIVRLPNKSAKDWIAPIIGAVLVVVGVIGMFTGGWGTPFLIAGIGMLVGSVASLFLGQDGNKQDEFKQNYSLSGGKNQNAQGKTLPIVLGTHRVYPLIIGNYFNELATEGYKAKTYMTVALCLGQKNLRVRDIKIGDNILARNPSGAYGYVNVDSNYDAQVEIRNGSTLEMYQQKRVEQQLGQEIVAGWEGSQSTANNTDSFYVVYTFQGLGGYNEEGDKQGCPRQIRVWYRPHGSNGEWKLGSDRYFKQWNPDKQLTYHVLITPTAEEKAANPSKKWEVLVNATENAWENSDHHQWYNKCYWQLLQSRIDEPIVRAQELAQMTVMCIRIKADKNISGVIEEINAICSSIVPCLNNGQWNNNQETDNPAALLRWVLSLYFENGFDANGIDDETLQMLYNWCEENDYGCDAVVMEEDELRNVINKILLTARSKMILKTGKISAHHDDYRDNPICIFTPKNSHDFSYSKAFSNAVNGLNIKWVDPAAGYKETTSAIRLVGESVQEGDNVQDVDLFGITSYERCTKLGRYMLAANRYRTEIYKIGVGVENYSLPIGARVFVATDVLAIGRAQGRIEGSGTDEHGVFIQLDEIVHPFLDDGSNVYLRIFNIETGEITRHQVYRNETDTNKFYLVDVSAELPPIGSIYSLGTDEVIDCVIQDKEPNEDGATLTLVNYDESIFRAVSEPIPPYEPKVSDVTPAGAYDLLPEPDFQDGLQNGLVGKQNFGAIWFDFANYAIREGVFQNRGTLGRNSTVPSTQFANLTREYDYDRELYVNYGVNPVGKIELFTDNIMYYGNTVSMCIKGITGTGYLMSFEDANNGMFLHIEKNNNSQIRLYINGGYRDVQFDWSGTHILTLAHNMEEGILALFDGKTPLVKYGYRDDRRILQTEDETDIMENEDGESVITGETVHIDFTANVDRTIRLEFMVGLQGKIGNIRLWNLYFEQNRINELYTADYVGFNVAILADYLGEFVDTPEVVRLGDSFKFIGTTNYSYENGHTYWLTEGGWVLYENVKE